MNNKINPKYMLNRSKKGISSMLFGRTGIILIAMCIQLTALFLIFNFLTAYIHLIYGGIILTGVFAYLYLLNSDIESNTKVTWIVLFTIFPVIGIFLFVFTKFEIGHRVIKKRITSIYNANKTTLIQEKEVLETIKYEDVSLYHLSNYINSTGVSPVCSNNAVKYFSSGEIGFQNFLHELEQANDFIFMEYFILEEGYMWGSILEILEKKAKEGVEIRVMYDGFCELSLLPHSYPKKLKQLGIQCKVFSPIKPFVSTVYNFRDHRKMCIIDGHTVFTGGINLADEYINKKERFGYWKDNLIMLKGSSTRSFIMMFLQMWNLDSKVEDFTPWLCKDYPIYEEEGYVLPYGDSPLDSERIGETIYIDILNRAENYVYIMTPYLIIDSELEFALCYASKRGIDVRIILPHKPDKKSAFALAHTSYHKLITSGVKIYEYTPGFIHSKTFLSDDTVGTVGTVNLDYRSFYHHFECGVYLKNISELKEIKNDFESTFKISKKIHLDSLSRKSKRLCLFGYMIKIFSPLM